jgi:L-lactate dehydrogenase
MGSGTVLDTARFRYMLGEHCVLTVSCRLEGEYGLSDVCLSVPCVLSREGISRVVVSQLPANEQAELEKSAAVLKATLAQVRAPG